MLLSYNKPSDLIKSMKVFTSPSLATGFSSTLGFSSVFGVSATFASVFGASLDMSETMSPCSLNDCVNDLPSVEGASFLALFSLASFAMVSAFSSIFSSTIVFASSTFDATFSVAMSPCSLSACVKDLPSNEALVFSSTFDATFSFTLVFASSTTGMVFTIAS